MGRDSLDVRPSNSHFIRLAALAALAALLSSRRFAVGKSLSRTSPSATFRDLRVSMPWALRRAILPNIWTLPAEPSSRSASRRRSPPSPPRSSQRRDPAPSWAPTTPESGPRITMYRDVVPIGVTRPIKEVVQCVPRLDRGFSFPRQRSGCPRIAST